MNLEDMNVSDMMITALITMKADETIGRADVEMKLASIRHIPVTDERGKLVGLLSNRDILKAVHEATDKRIKVADIMTKRLYTIAEDAPAHHAAALMMEHKIGALPVVADDGHLVGLVTETDFVRIAHQALGGVGYED
jgi:CBS domain-containing protein